METTRIQPEKKQSFVDTATYLVLFTVALSLIDFSFHPNGGVSDPERRKIMIDILGPLAKHLGNYGFSAALAISAVFAKNILSSFIDGELGKKIVSKTFLGVTASIMTLNGLIETFRGNNDLAGDIGVGVLAVASSTIGAELAVRKYKKAKRVRKKALAQKNIV